MGGGDRGARSSPGVARKVRELQSSGSSGGPSSPIPHEKGGNDSDGSDNGDDDDTASDYSSVSVDELPSIKIWDRTYHGSGRVLTPNDDLERHRLTVQHQLFKLCLDGELTAAKLPTDRPLAILDVGCGTGQWAIEMGERYANAHVMGIDLCARMLPTEIPPNVTFEIEDAAAPWARAKGSLDFVHCRNVVGGGIRDYRALLVQAYDHLRPGGQVEFAEVRARWWDFDENDDSDGEEMDKPLSADKGPASHEMEMALIEMGQAFGIDFDPIPRIPGILSDIGFEKVTEMSDLVPIYACGHDEKLRQKGACLAQNVTYAGLEGYIARLCEMSGWSQGDLKDLLKRVSAEVEDTSLRVYGKIVFVTARKPLSA